jgi:5-methylcytosine-specific restriction endonuclease McrA
MADSLQERKDRYNARVKRLETRQSLLRLFMKLLCLRKSFRRTKEAECRRRARVRRALRAQRLLVEKTCTHCGIPQPRMAFARHDPAADGRAPACKTCAKAVTAAWREIPGNREHGVQQMRDWMQIPGNKERKATLDKAWHSTHLENGRLSGQRRRERHKDDPTWFAYHRQKTKEWERNHPENVRQRAVRRYGRKKGIPQIEVVDINVLYERDHATCSLCQEFCPREEATQDHIIPITKPGSEESYANSALAHNDCNRRKNNKIIVAQMLAYYTGDGANMARYVPAEELPSAVSRLRSESERTKAPQQLSLF